ncbi:MAG TPA: hypothetical protein VEL70_07710 [Candidatus Acidoferrum sp.]|nr:hypothetical protein [Candidatus Acidoferrum sp.]
MLDYLAATTKEFMIAIMRLARPSISGQDKHCCCGYGAIRS